MLCYFCCAAAVICYRFRPVGLLFLLTHSLFLPSHADCSPATLHFRIAVFVKPTPPVLPPSFSSPYSDTSHLRSLQVRLSKVGARHVLSHTILVVLPGRPHNVWWWEIVLGREPPWSRVSAGALLNGTCLMVYNLFGDSSDTLVHRPGSTCYPQREGVPLVGVAVCQGPIRSAC